jgi:hypothetical protein
MAGEIYLTLTTGADRWEGDEESGNIRSKEEGSLWLMAGAEGGSFVILKPEVADWCWENIGAYRIVEDIPSDNMGPDGDDSWRIEFKSDTDMAFFKMRWMGE